MNNCRQALALAVLAIWLCAPGYARASRLFFSASATSPSEKTSSTNPTFKVVKGQTLSVYLWADVTSGQAFTGLGHDIVSSDPIVQKVGSPNTQTYIVDDPEVFGQRRWGTNGVNTGVGSGTFVIDDANFVKIGGSPLGAFGDQDPTFDPITGTYRVTRLDLRATTLGETELRLGVGFSGITFSGSAADTTINFGFGDAAIAGNDARRNTSTAVSDLADALIQVVSAWQNPVDPLDVNGSGTITPLDALQIINELNAQGSHVLPDPTEAFGPPPFFDVSGSGAIEPQDALIVINFLNDQNSLSATAEMASALAVPEPSTALLLGIGALAAVTYRRWRGERKSAALG